MCPKFMKDLDVSYEEYNLSVLDDEGNWKLLASRVTYEDATCRSGVYADQFPGATFEITPHILFPQ